MFTCGYVACACASSQAELGPADWTDLRGEMQGQEKGFRFEKGAGTGAFCFYSEAVITQLLANTLAVYL